MFYFGVYEKLKYGLANYLPGTLSIMVAGGFGGLAFWTSIYPVDVVKSNMQTDHSDRSQRKYKTLIDCANQIYKREGFRGFWKGYLACVYRSIPTNALAFLAYECVKDFL